jgi:beta-lactamase class A
MGTMLEIRQVIDDLIKKAPGQVGLVIKDLKTGETLQWAAQERFPAASLIKIPVLIETLRQHQMGELKLDESITIRAEDKVGGFGILKELESVSSISLLDLLTLMIIISDNTAANLCITRVGISAVNKTLASLGLSKTILQRKMMDLVARERGLDNFTTPSDMAQLLELFTSHSVLTPNSCDLALGIMKRQQVNDRLPLLIPPQVTMAHKTGEWIGVRHDVGIMFVESGPLVIAALTKNFNTQLDKGLIGGEASALIAQISRLVYGAVTK